MNQHTERYWEVRWRDEKADNERLRAIILAALTKLDTMNVCCREMVCERTTGDWKADPDDSCAVHDVRKILTAAALEQSAAPGGLPALDKSLHTPEVIASLQRPAMKLDQGEQAAAADMRAFGASEAACYKWPDDTPEHKALRAAYIEGAADCGEERHAVSRPSRL